MRRTVLRTIIAITLVSPGALHAQHGGGGGAQRSSATAPKEAEQLGFLVGQWELTVMPKVSSVAARIHGQPKLLGTWKAWRAFDGFGIEDELRIMDGSGNPNALSHSMRTYDAVQGKWLQTTLDVYRGRFTSATGSWENGEYHTRSAGRDAEGKPYIQRVRFYEITKDSFKYQADRSTDGERTWETAVLRIEAKRTAATAAR